MDVSDSSVSFQREQAMYSRIKYDVFFKKIFQQEHLLKAFLNTVLRDELPAPIQKLHYQHTDLLTSAERQYLNLIKHTVIDVFVTTEAGTRAIVEIQKGTTKTDLIRFIDYQCRNFSHQFRAGDDYAQVVPCYCIGWLFDMTPPHQAFKEKIRIASDQSPTDWSVAWEIIALYPRCIPPEHLLQPPLDSLEEWLLLDVVTDPRKSQEIKTLLHTPEVQEAFEQLDISGLTDDEIRELDFQQAIAERYQKPFELRIQQAKAEVRKEQMRLMAKNLLDVLDTATIAAKTGLTCEEVDALRNSDG